MGKAVGNIALDIDGMLASTIDIVTRIISEDLGIDFTPDMQFTWAVEDVVSHYFDIQLTHEDVKQYFAQAWRDWEYMPMSSPDVADIWWELHVSGHDADIVTDQSDDETFHNKMRWVDSFLSGTPKVINARDIDPRKFTMNYGVFIDDNAEIITGATAAGKYGILFDQPYNRDVSDSEITERISSVDQILPVLRRLRENGR